MTGLLTFYLFKYKRINKYGHIFLREQPFDPPYNAPCSHAEGVFKEYLKFSFEVHGLLPAAMVVSVESLVTDPNGSEECTYIDTNSTYIHI